MTLQTICISIISTGEMEGRRCCSLISDPMDRMPLYEQIQAQIARHVMHGLLKEGDQLPSVRQLALDVGINPNTVQKAYRELERRGLIARCGARSFIAAIMC